MTDATDRDWDDPDRAVQVEDDDPERLAGDDDVEFDPDDGAGDEGEPQEDFPSTAESSNASDANLPAEGA